MIPFFAAYTRPIVLRCLRAVSITAAAVALMTAVTPPDCAYSRLPVLIPGSVVRCEPL